MRPLHGNFLLFAEDNRLLTDIAEEVRGNKGIGKKEYSRLRQYVSNNLTFLNTLLHTVHHFTPVAN